MDIQAHTHAQFVTKAANVLGVNLPADYLAALDHAATFETAAAAITVTAEQLNHAALDVIEAGGNIATDATVRELSLGRQLCGQSIDAAARYRSNQLIANAITEHSDSILSAMSAALEKHSEALAAAAQSLREVQNLRDVAAAGVGDRFETWAKARTAEDAWRAASTAFFAIAAVSQVGCNEQTAPLVLTPADATAIAAALELARSERNPELDVWHMARSGAPLGLPTGLGDYMHRVARFDQQRAAFQREREQARSGAGFDGATGR